MGMNAVMSAHGIFTGYIYVTFKKTSEASNYSVDETFSFQILKESLHGNHL